MRRQGDNSGKLFLTELMIAIFFFSLITAVCVQLFAEAHAMSLQSEKLTEAVNAAANTAECYSSWDFQKESWEKIFPKGSWDQNTWRQQLDADFCQCEKDGQYLLEMQLEKKGRLCEAHIRVTEKGREKEIYALTTKRVWGE